MINDAFVSPILVGRDPQLATFARVIERAAGGAGGLVLVSGEAGIGKSRWTAAAADRARAAGFLVLHGHCFETDRSLPYAPVLDLVRTFVRTHPPGVVRHALEPAAVELVALAPDLARVLPDISPGARLDPEHDRQRLVHAIARALVHLAGVQPLLVVIEDLHWGDEASLDLVVQLAGILPGHRVILALTYRSDEWRRRSSTRSPRWTAHAPSSS